MRRLQFAFIVLALGAWPAVSHGQSVAFNAIGDPALVVHDAQPLEQLPPLKGAPFTADAITEFTQVLSDGNRIERTFTTSIARDGRGRTRREQEIALVGPLAELNATPPKIVTISDPDSGANYTLDSRQKTAIKSTAIHIAAVSGTTDLRTTRAASAGVNVAPPVAGARVDWTGASGGTVRVAIDNQLIFGASPVDTLIAVPEVAVQPLGTSQIEGVAAEGTRSTMTIPAGAIGNISPIEVVTERWFSKELGMAVKITRRDPRSGDSVYRLANIVRVEPPPDLFVVPPDYQVR